MSYMHHNIRQSLESETQTHPDFGMSERAQLIVEAKGYPALPRFHRVRPAGSETVIFAPDTYGHAQRFVVFWPIRPIPELDLAQQTTRRSLDGLRACSRILPPSLRLDCPGRTMLLPTDSEHPLISEKEST